MNNFKGLFIGFMLVAAFSLALIGFGINLAADNEPNQTIANDPYINSTYTNIITKINTAETNINRSKVDFEEGSILENIGELIFGSIIGFGKTVGSIITGTYDLATGLIYRYLGIPPIIISVISIILMATIVFLAWRLYKIGE